MKDSYLAKTLMQAGFALGLFASQQNFILTTPDNSPVGQGMFEAGSGDSIQVRVTVHGKEFTGTGIMSPVPPIQNKAVRSDRTFMESLGMSRSKRGLALLNAKDGSALSCEFNVRNELVDGRCINPVDQHALTIHSSTKNQP